MYCYAERAKTQNAAKGTGTLHNAIKGLTQVVQSMPLVFGEWERREIKSEQKHYFLHTSPTGQNSATFILLK